MQTVGQRGAVLGPKKSGPRSQTSGQIQILRRVVEYMRPEVVEVVGTDVSVSVATVPTCWHDVACLSLVRWNARAEPSGTLDSRPLVSPFGSSFLGALEPIKWCLPSASCLAT